MDNKPNYYAIITANVRYDRRLKANEKLIYAEITALSNKYGYCTASNGYFSKVFEYSTRAVSTWINHLKELGYVNVDLIRENKEIKERRIYISNPMEKKVNSPMEKNFNRPTEENFNSPIEKKFAENNTSINNTSINNNNIDEMIEDKKRVYAKAEQLFNLTSLIIEDIDYDLKEHNAELLLHAMEVTARSAERITYNYYKSVLSNWDKRGLKTVSEVNKYEEERANKNKKFKQRKTIDTNDANVGLNW